MNKILYTFLVYLCAFSAHSSTWKADTVYMKDRSVGYVYHTSAIGTKVNNKITKSVTGFRFVCSAKNNESLIGVFWNDSNFTQEEISVTYIIDTNTISRELTWYGNNHIIYRNMQDSANIIQDLSLGKTIKFTWSTPDGSKYTTAFNIAGIDFTDFNAKCNKEHK